MGDLAIPSGLLVASVCQTEEEEMHIIIFIVMIISTIECDVSLIQIMLH